MRQFAWQRALQLSAAASQHAPPVRLHELAANLRIVRIELLPMLCTAAVGAAEDGYIVYINPTARGAERITKTPLGISDGDFRCLSVPLRFCIAHEMGHVLFFESLGGDCRHRLLARHWRALENSCSQIARVLLLPRDALLREIGPSLFDAERLLRTARRFKVSPTVLVYRLHIDDVSAEYQRADSGLVACIQRRGGEAKVVAVHALGDLGRVRWPHSKRHPKGMLLKELYLCDGAAAALTQGGHGEFDADVFWRAGQVAPASIEVKWHNSSNAIVCIRMHGHLEKRTTTEFGR